MIITKRGIPPEKRMWHGRCNSCGSEAEAEQRELTRITENQRDGYGAWEKCPVCGKGDAHGIGGMFFLPVKPYPGKVRGSRG
jgi:NAD-dependent SIR2 family protein deacetylase